MFNTLECAKKLEGVGFSREQAETTVEILAEIMMENLATKDDLKSLSHEMKFLESRIVIKAGAMQAASIAIIVALLKLL